MGNRGSLVITSYKSLYRMSKKRERVTVKKWTAVTQWAWDIASDNCAICKSDLHEPSIQYVADPMPYNDQGLQIAVGGCNHTYHLDCINRWLKVHPTCPLCNKDWEFLNIMKQHGSDPEPPSKKAKTEPSKSEQPSPPP